jgi:hypothetical protein
MKTQIVLPDAVAEALKETIPLRKRSQFIAEAVAVKLRALRFQQALKKAAGAWRDQNHSDLNTQGDVNRYLARFRKRLSSHG